MPIFGMPTPYDLERIKKAKSFIEMNYQKNIYTEEIASEVKMDIKQLQEGIRSETGMTLHSYLLKVRVDLAADHLADFSKTIKYIAQKYGFSNPGHFSTEFKKQRGVSPKEYRYNLLAMHDNP